MEQAGWGEDARVGQKRLNLELSQLDLRYALLRIAAPARAGRILSSLAEHGQHSPVLVVAGSEGHYVLIDGYRRIEALEKLGRDTVEVLVLPMEEAEALVYGLRESRGSKRSAMEEGWWIRQLLDEHRFTMERIAVSLERSKSWVSRRVALVKQLPEPVQSKVRRGTICPHAAMRYLAPLARANKGACERLSEHIGNARLSARQTETLYAAWRRADRDERVRIEENPLLYLKAVEETERNRGQADPGALLKDLEILIRLCRSIRRSLDANAAAPENFTTKVSKRWQESLSAFETIREPMEEILYAGRGCTQNHL